MSEFKFQWQKFKMENSAKDFLEKYISRIKKYAKSYNIPDDLVDDIEQSVLEKLLNEKWDISQKKIVKIVNSIWEPEDIFEWEVEEVQEAKHEKSKTQKYSPLILWVCAWLAELINIPVWIVRLLFVFLIFGYTFWIWLYLIIFLIRFVTNRESASESVSSRIKRIISRIWDWIRRLWKAFLFIVKRSFLILWTLFLIFVLICLWVFLYYLIFGFVKANIDYTTIFPWITKAWVIFWIISAFILLLNSIGCMIEKKLSNTTTIIAAIWCGLLAVIIAIISILQIYTKINFISWSDIKETREQEIAISDKETPIHININRTIENWDFLITENRFVSVLPSDNDQIKVVYTFHFKWKWEELVTAVENISDIDYSWDGDTLNIWLKNSEIFSKVTPFIPTTIEIDLYLPKDLKFDFKNSGIRLINIDTPKWAEWSHASLSVRDCETIKYNKEANKFLCEIHMSRDDIYNIAKANLKEKADEIVPLKWLHKSWSQTSNEQYWRLDSINITDDGKLLAKFSDQFFNFFMIIEYTIDEETWEFELISSSMKNVEQKWMMDDERMKYYEWRENLTGFEIQMEDEI